MNVGSPSETRSDVLSPLPHNNDHIAHAGSERGIDYVADHRLATHFMQHLGLVGFHPLALSSRQNDCYRTYHNMGTPSGICDEIRSVLVRRI